MHACSSMSTILEGMWQTYLKNVLNYVENYLSNVWLLIHFFEYDKLVSRPLS